MQKENIVIKQRRHAERAARRVSASSTHVVTQRPQQRQAWKIPYQVRDDNTNFTSGLHPTYNGNGFTLIELLVVVLIIGILAAVALPQYQVAVLKTRYANLMTNVKAVHDAEEIYYLANGSYTDDPSELDYVVGCNLHPEGRMHYGGYVFCNGFDIDINAGWSSYHPMGFIDFRLAYTHHQDHGINPSIRECFAKTDDSVANKVCKSFGGVEVRTATGVVDAGGNVTVYQLN